MPRRASLPASSSSITDGEPTRTICSVWPICSTRNTASTSSAPRAPLTLPSFPGYHWYVVPRVGYPDPETFHAAYAELARFHDELWKRTGIGPERTVLGGFSMGSVMSYAAGFGGDRPAPAGVMAFSGFVPTVEGWQPSLDDRVGLPVFIAHGRRDPVIEVAFARQAKALLETGGLSVEYHEADAAHHIDPADVPRAAAWLSKVVSR